MNNSIEHSNSQQLHVSNKINATHLDRLAIIYVRQSSKQQVEEHQESTRLQYALRDKAYQLGWPKSNILVIDQDLGCSGSSIEGRLGFQQLMTEVALGNVGIVLGREASRLARSSLDWHKLLESCAIFATLIGDQDGIYDPATYNDRLLLGLKGSMSEAELHILKQRMLEGRWAKAQRGELQVRVPKGYVCTADGKVSKDPDEQVRFVIETIFAVFERELTIHGVLRYLVEHHIQVPCRIISGLRKGELEWHRPNRDAITNQLKNPIYTGAYVYGKRRIDPRKKVPGHRFSGHVKVPIEQCEVFIKDQLPAYISWQQFEQNQQQMKSNQPQNLGTARQGSSLLSGLLICGLCGGRMTTAYSHNGRALRYVCNKQTSRYGGDCCQSMAGKQLDEAVKALIFAALEPAALEISLRVASDIEAEQERLTKHWEQRLERAKIDTERAYRQYNAVEPENRLVARTLERQWEEALTTEEKLKQEFEHFLAQVPAVFGAAEQEQVRQLAVNIPSLWVATTTTAADRQQIARLLIERIVVTVKDHSEKVTIKVCWHGGHQTELAMIRPVARFDQLSCYDDLLKRIKTLYDEGKSYAQIAKTLNDENWPTPKLNSQYRIDSINQLLPKLGISEVYNQWRFAHEIEREAHEWTVNELSSKIGFAPYTIQRWAKNGQVTARKVEVHGIKIWLIKVDEAELAELNRIKKHNPTKHPLRRHHG